MENRVLTIKREKKAIVKDENEMTDYPCQLEYVKRTDLATQVAELTTEKAAIIEQLVAIKGDNQHLHLKLKRHEDDAQKSKQAHLAAITELNAKVTNLENKLKAAIHSRIDAELEIKQLTKQNNVYTAQIKQLQQAATVSTMPEAANDANETVASSEEYEVECIQKHRTIKGRRRYLVRWKDYTAENASWIWEEDLFCPDILATYKQKKKLL